MQYLQLVLGLSRCQTVLRLLPLTFATAEGLVAPAYCAASDPRRMVCGVFLLTPSPSRRRPRLADSLPAGCSTTAFVLLGFGEIIFFGATSSMLSESGRSGGRRGAIGETSYELGAGMGIGRSGCASTPPCGWCRTPRG